MFEITLTLDKTNKEALYVQLYKYFIKEIQNGQIKAGMKLPSKRKLALHLGIGLNTVDTAYQQLMAEGYVESQLRKGYYVADLEPISALNEPLPVTEGIMDPLNERNEIDYNHGRVDVDSFPHAVWKKCLNNTLYLQEREMFMSGDPQGEWGLRLRFHPIYSNQEEFAAGLIKSSLVQVPSISSIFCGYYLEMSGYLG